MNSIGEPAEIKTRSTNAMRHALPAPGLRAGHNFRLESIARLTSEYTLSPLLCPDAPTSDLWRCRAGAVNVVSMLITTRLETQKVPHQSSEGRPRKIFRDPTAPYAGCKCGQCPRCIDNAKWSRLFEKFVDPGYYDRPVRVSMRSPLSGF
jgi:hypothetical protein